MGTATGRLRHSRYAYSVSERSIGMQGNTAIELKLDKCLCSLISRARRGASGNLSAGHLHMLANYTKARVPSWLHLPSLPAFTERARLLSDEEDDGPTPPLSHYARDEALREVAIHGNSAAASLLITRHSEDNNSPPASTSLVNSPPRPMSPQHGAPDGAASKCAPRRSQHSRGDGLGQQQQGAPSAVGGRAGRFEGPAAGNSHGAGVANGPVGVLHNAGGGYVNANVVMSRAAMAMALQRRVRSVENMQDFTGVGGTPNDGTVGMPTAHQGDFATGRVPGGRRATDVTGQLPQ
jgi:hypothetical protein